jgi:hypothetical protein
LVLLLVLRQRELLLLLLLELLGMLRGVLLLLLLLRASGGVVLLRNEPLDLLWAILVDMLDPKRTRLGCGRSGRLLVLVGYRLGGESRDRWSGEG